MDNRPISVDMDIWMMEGQPTSSCPHCCRKFFANVLAKHTKIARKFFKRKEKNLIHKNKELLMWTCITYETKSNNGKKMGKANQKIKGRIHKWKIQSMEFSKFVEVILIVLFKLEKLLKEVLREKVLEFNNKFILLVLLLDSFILCKFCNRRYNDEVNHKHLPGCERRYKEAQMRNKL